MDRRYSHTGSGNDSNWRSKMSNLEKRNWKARVTEEFERFLAIAAYLWVLLAVLQLHRGMILMSYGISYSYLEGVMFALVNALILGKFMLIAEALHAAGRWRIKPFCIRRCLDQRYLRRSWWPVTCWKRG